MPIYEFEMEDGSIVEEYFHVRNVPSIGHKRELEDGRVGTRIPSNPMGAMVRRNVAFTSHQAPRVWTGEGPDPAPRRDKKGRPVLRSRREAIEFGRASGMTYDAL